jgi:dUTP pyrophosphatase
MEVPVFRFALKEGLDDSFLPTKANSTDTGWDVRSAESLSVGPGQYIKIPLGFRVFAPEGWWLELRPRSSSFAKKHLHALYGVIDEGFESECLFAAEYLPERVRTYHEISTTTAYYMPNDSFKIEKGEAIGQLVPIKRQEMTIERVSNEEFEKLCKARNTSRGTGGFGSTG